ncbi:MAG: S8 family serine peptidase, partial [Planctomycetes bacterium]|nr:S8 family serine peptidase [Planctomycetota bacterium]
AVTGSWGEGNGFGGGLSTAYSSNTTIVNSIIWNNVSDSGAQIAVGTGNIYGPMPSVLDITYCDIGPAFDPNLVKFDLEIAFTDTASQTYSGPKLAGEQEIYDRFNAGQSTVKVIVTLAGPTTSAQPLIWQDPESLDIFRQEVTQAQGSVLSSLGASEFTLEYEYENIAAFSGEVTIAGLNQLLDDPAVATIEPVRYCQPVLAQAIPLANAMAARQAFDGTGVAIAIVDTGVDYTHPMLGGGTFPNSKVIGGYDTGVGDADPIAVGNAHGTACAGIAAGDLGIFEDYIGGVTPGAKIYALKATPDDSGSFPSSATLAAWDWCITHRHDDPANPIVVMSNSWGMPGTPFNNSAAADAYSPAMTSAAANATEAGITILAASGNDGFAGQGISWPSAMSDVISVGAVFDTTDAVTDYSNTAE